jgi:hypothetical protein
LARRRSAPRSPLPGVAHQQAAEPDGKRANVEVAPDLLQPDPTGRESCTPAAAEPALGYLLDHRDRPGGQGGLEPASSAAATYSPKDRGTNSRRGTARAYAFPSPFPERPEQPLQSVGHRPAQPGRSALASGDSDAPGSAPIGTAGAARPRPAWCQGRAC